MKITNTHNLPQAYVNAIPEPRPLHKDAASITQLLRPAQQTALLYRYWDDVTEDVADMAYALLGISVHYLLEKGGGHGFNEERLTSTLGGITITGTPDLLEGFAHQEGNDLWDYKVTTRFKVTGDLDPNWRDQLTGYAWLWAQNGFWVEHAYILAILRDWSKRQSRIHPDYPPLGVAVLPVELPPKDGWEERLASKIVVYRAAIEGEYEPCTPEQRWEKGRCWAVMKDGRKAALRLCPESRQQAEEFCNEKGLSPLSHYIVERPGESIRCEDFCSVAPFCQQWQELRGIEDVNESTD